jgi:tetratricopeptide (TPR) repeat protein
MNDHARARNDWLAEVAGPVPWHPLTSRRYPGRVRRRTWVLALGLVLLTLLAYLPVLRAGYVWDDNHYVAHNQTLRDADGLRRLWTEVGATPQYYPVVFTSFWLEARLWGTGPEAAPRYHLTNVLLHGLAAVLLWLILSRLRLGEQTGEPDEPDLVAWAAALLFALHPVLVESVAWITERKNVLSGVLALGSLLAWLRWRDLGRRTTYALSLGLFLGALLAKTVVAVMPPAALVIVWWREGRVHRRDLISLAPFLALGAGLGLFTAHLERTLVGASGAEFALAPGQRLLLAGRVPWFYLSCLVWPFGLSFEYPRWIIDASSPAQWLFPRATVLSLAAAFALRSRWGRGPLAALLLFGGCLFPVLGFLDVYPFRFSWVADHFQYLASIGILTGAAWLAARALRGRDPRIGIALLAATALLLGGLTARRCFAFQSYEALLRDTIATNPEAWRAHSNLGKLLTGMGRTQQALSAFERAAALQPDDAVVALNQALALSQAGRGSEATRAFERALALDPDWAKAHLLLADHLSATNAADGAVLHYRRAAELGEPKAIPRLRALVFARRADLRVTQAQQLIERGAHAEARTVLREVLAFVPEHAGALRLLRSLEERSPAELGGR